MSMKDINPGETTMNALLYALEQACSSDINIVGVDDRETNLAALYLAIHLECALGGIDEVMLSGVYQYSEANLAEAKRCFEKQMTK